MQYSAGSGPEGGYYRRFCLSAVLVWKRGMFSGPREPLFDQVEFDWREPVGAVRRLLLRR